MNLLTEFVKNITQHKLFNKKDKLLIAVSGGIDSLVLCELCFQSGFDFSIAHCNFQLRGIESDEDEMLVEELGKKYGVIVYKKKIDIAKYIADHNANIQIAARELRYQWFNELIDAKKEAHLKYILTAHHANDNIETVLMNFLKGTGISGLQGIQSNNAGIGNRIIRPLLFAKKETIVSFAMQHKLSWREDSSNESIKYTRNYFRNELIPSIKKVYPQVEENILKNIERFKEVHELYNIAVKQIVDKIIVRKGAELHFPILKLLKAPALNTILYEIFKSSGFSVQQIPEIIKLCDSDSGKFILSDTHRVIKNRQWIILSPINASDLNLYLIEEGVQQIQFQGNRLLIENKKDNNDIIFDQSIAQIDSSFIHYPMVLRKWKQGDYFYPLGMNKKKKVSRFLIDNKLSLIEKENIWVVESNKKIVWVVGWRIDDRCKIYPGTKSTVQLTISK